ncbi:MAG: hypothetical protein ABJL64_20120 [Rhizobiaceae bacterium]
METKTIISALHHFRKIDNKMQVSMILSFLEIAAAQDRNEVIGVQEVDRKVGLQSGTASRNVAYWGVGAPNISKAMEFVNIDFDPRDRRKRVLTLTPKGKAFYKKIKHHLRESN